MGLTKIELLTASKLMLNEYKDKQFFKQNRCLYEPLGNEERFDVAHVQGHFAVLRLPGLHETLQVVFRGSEEDEAGNADWKSNWRFGLSKTDPSLTVITRTISTNILVHEGWLTDYQLVKSKILNKASQYDCITFIGHSRGSSLAVLAAENAAFHFPKKIVNVVPFSCPMVGNQPFVDVYKMRVDGSYHIWYGDDTVVRGPQNAPLLAMGYRPVPVESRIWKNWFLPWNWFTAVTSWPLDHYPHIIVNELPKRLRKFEDFEWAPEGVSLR